MNIFKRVIDRYHRYVLKRAENVLWDLATDVRCGWGPFENFSTTERQLMTSGVEFSILEIQKLISSK